MARKTTGSTTRSKKNVDAVQSVNVQVVPEVPRNSKSTNPVPVTTNIEQQIRVRAYELYLQRRATAGSAHDNPNQDWLIAEREVLSRQSDPGHHSA